MNAYELKQYIIENDLIVDILEDLGCHDISDRGNEIRCALPEHKNPTSVSIKKDTLYTVSYDDAISTRGDIYSFVMTLKKISFPECIESICGTLKVPYIPYKRDDKKSSAISPLDIFKRAEKTARSNNSNGKKIEIFNKLSNFYIKIPTLGWIQEGIGIRAIKRFNIGYDVISRRIVIPHRFWSGKDDDYVGIVGRTTIPEYEELGIPKYCSMTNFKYPKVKNVYGVQENYLSIQEEGYCVVYEAEKSVLKRYSLLDETGIAVSGSEISSEQVRIIVSLNVDIIIAMDRGITRRKIRSLCNKFYGLRPVYYLWDEEDNILHNKESPADLPDRGFQKLLRNKIRFDETERKKYLSDK